MLFHFMLILLHLKVEKLENKGLKSTEGSCCNPINFWMGVWFAENLQGQATQMLIYDATKGSAGRCCCRILQCSSCITTLSSESEEQEAHCRQKKHLSSLVHICMWVWSAQAPFWQRNNSNWLYFLTRNEVTSWDAFFDQCSKSLLINPHKAITYLMVQFGVSVPQSKGTIFETSIRSFPQMGSEGAGENREQTCEVLTNIIQASQWCKKEEVLD